jgi:hypothetical protein
MFAIVLIILSKTSFTFDEPGPATSSISFFSFFIIFSSFFSSSASLFYKSFLFSEISGSSFKASSSILNLLTNCSWKLIEFYLNCKALSLGVLFYS